MLLELTVFISGVCVMVLELIGIRILSPFFGGSIDVLTSIISVVLLSLSVGYWWGGKKADKDPTFKAFFKILFLSSIFVIVTFSTRNYYLSFIDKLNFDYRLKILWASFIMFFVVNFLLGMVSPYAIRLKLNKTSKAGSTSGNLYAISTLGSIIGTFLTGFFLIPLIAITKIIYLISFVLFLNSLFIYIFYIKKKPIIPFFIFSLSLFLGVLFSGNAKGIKSLVDVESLYDHIVVYDNIIQFSKSSKSSVRYLISNKKLYQSVMLLNDPYKLLFPYTMYFRLAEHFNPKLKNVLVLGGGAYSYPKYFLKNFPTGKIDVVEIDPKMTEIAKKYFFLKENSHLNVYHQDARLYLNNNKKKYNAIFVDVFSTYSPPYYLTTKETVKKIFSSLQEKGVVIVNAISSLEGSDSRLFKAQYETYSSVFPQVYAFDVYKNKAPLLKRNIILVGVKNNEKISFKNNDNEIQKYLDSLIAKKLTKDGLILTDDYAPVENMIIK